MACGLELAFPIQLGMSYSQLTNSHFSEGLKPPISSDIIVIPMICHGSPIMVRNNLEPVYSHDIDPTIEHPI